MVCNPDPDNVIGGSQISFERLKALVDKALPQHETDFNRDWAEFEQIYSLRTIDWTFKRLAMYFDISEDTLAEYVQSNSCIFSDYSHISDHAMKNLKFNNAIAKNIARKIEYIQTSACFRSTLIKIYEE